MQSFFKWCRRRTELSRHAARRRELESELSNRLACPVELRPAAAKGGYDEIYYVSHGDRRVAVVRANSPFRAPAKPPQPDRLVSPASAGGRLDREWTAYSKLCKFELSPQPIWRTQDAITCSWLEWQRASQLLIQNRDSLWNVAERVIPAICKMHDADVRHLDLNLGNILLDPNGDGVAFIDFEYDAAAWLKPEQQAAFDYLRVIDDCLRPRRGGRLLLAESCRMVELLGRHVPTEVCDANVEVLLSKLQRLAQQAEFRHRLRSVFTNL